MGSNDGSSPSQSLRLITHHTSLVTIQIEVGKGATSATSFNINDLKCNKMYNIVQHIGYTIDSQRLTSSVSLRIGVSLELGAWNSDALTHCTQKIGNIGYTPHYQQLNRQHFRQQTGNTSATSERDYSTFWLSFRLLACFWIPTYPRKYFTTASVRECTCNFS